MQRFTYNYYSLSTEELDELISNCVRNIRVAQEKLYKYFYAEMFSTCQRYTEHSHETLTILNDSFLKVFRCISSYRKELGNFRSWLKTIVINTAIDHTRRCKNNNRFIHIDHIEEPGEEDFILNYNWKQEEILQHFKVLPNVTRIVINLFAFDGYTHKDIAKELNISETTSRWHLAEARKKLKNVMLLKEDKLARYE